MNLHYELSSVIESPSSHGWTKQDSTYVPKRYNEPALPQTITSRLNKSDINDNDLEDDDTDENEDKVSQNTSDGDSTNTDDNLSEDDYDE